MNGLTAIFPKTSKSISVNIPMFWGGAYDLSLHRYGIILTIGIYASSTANGMFSEMKEKLSDLIIDFKSEQKTEICDDITEKMKQTYPEYDFTVILDSDLSD